MFKGNGRIKSQIPLKLDISKLKVLNNNYTQAFVHRKIPYIKNITN